MIRKTIDIKVAIEGFESQFRLNQPTLARKYSYLKDKNEIIDYFLDVIAPIT